MCTEQTQHPQHNPRSHTASYNYSDSKHDISNTNQAPMQLKMCTEETQHPQHNSRSNTASKGSQKRSTDEGHYSSGLITNGNSFWHVSKRRVHKLHPSYIFKKGRPVRIFTLHFRNTRRHRCAQLATSIQTANTASQCKRRSHLASNVHRTNSPNDTVHVHTYLPVSRYQKQHEQHKPRSRMNLLMSRQVIHYQQHVFANTFWNRHQCSENKQQHQQHNSRSHMPSSIQTTNTARATHTTFTHESSNV